MYCKGVVVDGPIAKQDPGLWLYAALGDAFVGAFQRGLPDRLEDCDVVVLLTEADAGQEAIQTLKATAPLSDG